MPETYEVCCVLGWTVRLSLFQQKGNRQFAERLNLQRNRITDHFLARFQSARHMSFKAHVSLSSWVHNRSLENLSVR